jgi:aryl-alcohol dehydrogenase-like predicted oxidoreductase
MAARGTLWPMRTRTFGTTDLVCSEIAFGTWALGSDWWGDTDAPDRLVARALDLGVTFFDTGDVYGRGRNEEIVGGALAAADRDRIQISTKFGYALGAERRGHKESERPQDWSPRHAREALEASLRRLGTDYVDLYQLHNPRMEAIQRDDLFEALDDLRAEGKLRHYGVALGPAIGWRDEGLTALRTRSVTALQTVYNLLEQEPGSDFLAAATGRGDTAVMARVPTSSGLLEDKYTLDTTFPEGDHRRHRPREWLVEGLQKVDKLRFLASDDRTMTQAALKFILAQPGMACVIPTITTIEELEEFAGASQAPDLTDDELGEIHRLYRAGFELQPA